LDSFRKFSDKRMYLAQQTDVINTPAREAFEKYNARRLEVFAVLVSHVPQEADANSLLMKESAAASAIPSFILPQMCLRTPCAPA